MCGYKTVKTQLETGASNQSQLSVPFLEKHFRPFVEENIVLCQNDMAMRKLMFSLQIYIQSIKIHHLEII